MAYHITKQNLKQKAKRTLLCSNQWASSKMSKVEANNYALSPICCRKWNTSTLQDDCQIQITIVIVFVIWIFITHYQIENPLSHKMPCTSVPHLCWLLNLKYKQWLNAYINVFWNISIFHDCSYDRKSKNDEWLQLVHQTRSRMIFVWTTNCKSDGWNDKWHAVIGLLGVFHTTCDHFWMPLSLPFCVHHVQNRMTFWYLD